MDLTYTLSSHSEFSLTIFFIYGLKSELRRELLLTKPLKLIKAMKLARTHEAKFEQIHKEHVKLWLRLLSNTSNFQSRKQTSHQQFQEKQ